MAIKFRYINVRRICKFFFALTVFLFSVAVNCALKFYACYTITCFFFKCRNTFVFMRLKKVPFIVLGRSADRNSTRDVSCTESYSKAV